jgi:signal transduction histidine kinase
VDEALGMIKVPDRIQIINKVHKGAIIWVDPDKITRVFINLVKNAIDAIAEKGTIEIKTHQTRDNVEIFFSDTGTGISEETLKRLFAPLVTTKAQGMGLCTICKRIIGAHGAP